METISSSLNETGLFVNESDEAAVEPGAGSSKDSLFEFVTEGVLLTVISTLGLLGNALSIYVLLKPSLRGIFSNVLTGLATFDALFLLVAIVTFGMPQLSTIYQGTTTPYVELYAP